jgi:hypothetical protein
MIRREHGFQTEGIGFQAGTQASGHPEICDHFSTHSIQKIKSPFDDL